ncbi:glycosyltransferase [Polynucleobacter paneuropaeus]|uniref:Glycosyltransferase n=1 Tax=Polynucleobacter paneuropaeus TaxID=2527775 RepID=A0A9Q2WKD0_9BURK|nr:glycosyltransferase [Polynucleobacter paneuropaeus]
MIDRPNYFSVITCTFNSEKHLLECINSVEMQNHGNYEHIFIDANSSDSTISIIHEYMARSNANVRLYSRAPRGISDAMNYGVNVAHGDVIVHLHSDDFFSSPSVFSEVRDIFLSKHVSLVIGNCRLTGRRVQSFTFPSGIFRWPIFKLLFIPLLFHINFVPHPSTFIKASVFERFGLFKEDFKVAMDYEFWLRVLKFNNYYLANSVFSVYRFSENTISSKYANLTSRELISAIRLNRSKHLISYAVYLIFLRPLIFIRRFIKVCFVFRGSIR